MRKIPLAAVALAVCTGAGPVAASIIVVGSSSGRQCYEAARDGSGAKSAIDTCNEALAVGGLTPSEVVATYVNRGVVKINARRYGAAIVDFDQAIAMDPSEPESYLNKASALLRSGGSIDEAKALFSESLERSTRRPELAYYGRAIAHEMSGEIKAAYLDYKRARDAAPRWREPARELSRFQVTRASSPM